MPPRLLTIVRREFEGHPYLAGFVVILVGLLLWAVIVPLPKRGVKNVILRGKKAIEQRDVEAIAPLLAKPFDSPLTGNRDQTIERFKEAFENTLSIEVKIKRIHIQLEGDRAEAVVEFYVSGTVRGGELYAQVPFRGLSGEATLANPLERCRLTLVKEPDDRWRISGAELLGPTSSGKT